MTRPSIALLLILATWVSAADRKLDDKCCRISWRSQHTGMAGHGEWTKEFYAKSWLRSGCFVPRVDLDEWVEIRHRGWFSRTKISRYRHLCSTMRPMIEPNVNLYSQHVNILTISPPIHSKHCRPGTYPVTVWYGTWLNRATGKVEHHGNRRNWCRVDGPRREE